MSTPSGCARRLGVRTALVDGEWIAGDVEVAADGTVAAVGVGGGSGAVGTGVAIPGLVDLQVNGFGGVDLRHAGADGYRVAGEALAADGATLGPADVLRPVGRLGTDVSRPWPRSEPSSRALCGTVDRRGVGSSEPTSKVRSSTPGSRGRTTSGPSSTRRSRWPTRW